MTTLITAAEAIRHTPVGADFPTAKLCQEIPAEELAIFVEKIGFDFYERLRADLVDYSAAPVWDADTTYAAGDFATLDGIVYESLADGNTEPIGDPLNANAWKEAPKFATDCFNSLWVDGFMRDYLAYSVVSAVLPHVTFPTGNIGTVQKMDDRTGIQTVNHPNYAKVIDSLSRGKALRFRLMAKHFQDHSGECDFSGTLGGELCGAITETGVRVRKTFYKR